MKAFISYQDGKETVEGIFELTRQTDNFIEIESNSNKITLPYHRVNKIKVKGGNKE
jgi:spore maturation protein CgeB